MPDCMRCGKAFTDRNGAERAFCYLCRRKMKRMSKYRAGK